MRELFLRKIVSYIKEEQLITAGDTVLAGVSGGADSLCLLEVLRACQGEMDFALKVIHVEHGIRGEESRADAAFVRQFCEERGLPCTVICVDAAAYARETKRSVEEAARELRYEAFETQAQAERNRDGQNGAVKIAVAHHKEDQAETVLWQMIRGSDIRGLGGMRAKRGDMIRPLLDVSRAQIEEFLRAEGIVWREDATNADPAYTRNRLRMEVLPVLTQLNAQAVGHLCELAWRLHETEDYLAQETAVLYARHVEASAQGGILVRDSLLAQQPLMQRRVIYRALETVSGSARDIGTKHVARVQELFSLQVGRESHLPYRVRAVRTYGGVALFSGEEQGMRESGVQAFLEQLHMEVLEHVPFTEISKKKYTKWFDYDKIKYSVHIRGRQSGDYLTIDGEGHRQKLKSYLVNEKIPRSERDRLPLLADGAHIMWVVGYRISDYYKVDENTKRVLKVQWSGGNEDE